MVCALVSENVRVKFYQLFKIVMVTIDPREIPVAKMHGYLLGAVTPRPIAFASTVDKNGNVNLSPFSFFNCFGANPPILVFSPSRRGRDNTTKDTYENLLQVPEVVINIVTYEMVQQASLASCEYPRGTNEFIKAGFTEMASAKVKPPCVKESPISMECKVLQIIPTGDGGAAGNLVICEVILMHISENVLDADGRIDPFQVDAVARLGGDYYARVQGSSVFKVPKPVDKCGIGFDRIPQGIRSSDVLTGNDLGILANVEALPDEKAVREFASSIGIEMANKSDEAIHRLAKQWLSEGKVNDAWKILLMRHQ
jgi:flavin reductase (DIM6/NTAB) family NADH-FMN oxidoreductase RutF